MYSHICFYFSDLLFNYHHDTFIATFEIHVGEKRKEMRIEKIYDDLRNTLKALVGFDRKGRAAYKADLVSCDCGSEMASQAY